MAIRYARQVVQDGTGKAPELAKEFVASDSFLLTYGDGVGNIDLDSLLSLHKKSRKTGTVTAVRPPARFGALVLDGNTVSRFSEKPQAGEGWISGGFMVFNPAVFRKLKGDRSILETDGLERLAGDRQLAAYRHEGFWQCMDTTRDKLLLERLWATGKAPWITEDHRP